MNNVGYRKDHPDYDDTAGEEENQSIINQTFIVGINKARLVDGVIFYVHVRGSSFKTCQWMNYEDLIYESEGKKCLNKFVKHPQPYLPVNFITNPQLYKPTTVPFDIGFITPQIILNFRIVDCRSQYLVKWESIDYDGSTWETNLPSPLVKDFISNNKISNPTQLANRNGLERSSGDAEVLINSPVYKNNLSLYSYQIDCLNWLIECWCNHQNCIIDDEPGLGKNIQSLAFINWLQTEREINGPYLIVTSLSSIPVWTHEINQWTSFRHINLIGKPATRKFIEQQCLFSKNKHGKSIQTKLVVDIILTTHETLIHELEFIKTIEFVCMIIDNANKVRLDKKNICLDYQSIKTDMKILLTKQCINNNPNELWKLLNFVAPSSFNNQDVFFNKYNTSDPNIRNNFTNFISSYYIHRLKEKVLSKEISYEETIIEVELTDIQRTFYRSMLEDNSNIFINFFSIDRLGPVLNQLRLICSHPYLIPGLDTLCIDKYKQDKNIVIDHTLDSDEEAECLKISSGKMIVLDKLLAKLKIEKKKILIISKIKEILDLIEVLLGNNKLTFERIDCFNQFESRKASIERYSNNTESSIFLIDSHNDMLSLILSVTDVIIIFDSEWDPKADILHINKNQKFLNMKNLIIYRFVTRNTHEIEIYKRAAHIPMENNHILDPAQPNEENLREFDKVMRKSADKVYSLNNCDDDFEEFSRSTIEQILEYHTIKVKHNIRKNDNSVVDSLECDISEDEDERYESQNYWESFFRKDKRNANRQSSAKLIKEKRINSPTDIEIIELEPDPNNQDNTRNTNSESLPNNKENLVTKQVVANPPTKGIQEIAKPSAPTISNPINNVQQTPRYMIGPTPYKAVNSNQYMYYQQTMAANQYAQFRNPIPTPPANQYAQFMNPIPVQQPPIPTFPNANNNSQLNVKPAQQPISKKPEKDYPTVKIRPVLNRMSGTNANQIKEAPQRTIEEEDDDVVEISKPRKQPPIFQQIPDGIEINDRDKYISLEEFGYLPKFKIIEVISNLFNFGTLSMILHYPVIVVNMHRAITFNVLLKIDSEDKKKYASLISRINPSELNKKLIEITEPITKRIFENDPKKILDNIERMDVFFEILCFLSSKPYPKNFMFAAGMISPPRWSIEIDYALIKYFVEKGQSVAVKTLLVDSPLSKLLELTKLSIQWIQSRLKIIFYEMRFTLSVNKYSGININDFQRFKTVDEFRRMNEDNELTIIPRSIGFKIVRAIFLFGLPYDPDVTKRIAAIKRISLVKIETSTLQSFVDAIVEQCEFFTPEFSFYRCPTDKKFKELWLNKIKFHILNGALNLFHTIRSCLQPKDCFLISDLEKWEEAPDWWNLTNDKMLFEQSFYTGLLHFSPILRAIPDPPLSEESIKFLLSKERFQVSPVMFPSPSPLSKLTIQQRFCRLEKIIMSIKKNRLYGINEYYFRTKFRINNIDFDFLAAKMRSEPFIVILCREDNELEAKATNLTKLLSDFSEKLYNKGIELPNEKPSVIFNIAPNQYEKYFKSKLGNLEQTTNSNGS